jgi:hypothetical protein
MDINGYYQDKICIVTRRRLPLPPASFPRSGTMYTCL